MKRVLLVVASAVLFVGTLVIPTVVKADGSGGTGTGCTGKICKP